MHTKENVVVLPSPLSEEDLRKFRFYNAAKSTAMTALSIYSDEPHAYAFKCLRSKESEHKDIANIYARYLKLSLLIQTYHQNKTKHLLDLVSSYPEAKIIAPKSSLPKELRQMWVKKISDSGRYILLSFNESMIRKALKSMDSQFIFLYTPSSYQEELLAKYGLIN